MYVQHSDAKSMYFTPTYNRGHFCSSPWEGGGRKAEKRHTLSVCVYVCEAGCRAVNSIIIIVVVVGVVVCRTHIFFCHHPAS